MSIFQAVNAAELVEIAVELLNPPDRSEAVVKLASPDELRREFESVLSLSLDSAPPASIQELADALRLVIDHSVRTSHPRFINQNFAGADPVAVIGDWVAAALNTTAATFEMAPVFTLMEHELVRRLAELAGLPNDLGRPAGMFCAGGSIAQIHALQMARHRQWPSGIATGYGSTRPVVFVSEAGHYSTRKAAALMGIGTDAVVSVAVDETGAMLASGLRDAIAGAKANGLTPTAVVATAGTTVRAAFDPIDALADVCEAEAVWLHVDGCYGGSALFSPAHRDLLEGVHRADSMVWNLHKMMGMTQQCTALLVRRPDDLTSCFAAKADYLFQPDKLHAELDVGDNSFVCARRIDVLKLWLAWKASGDDGFAARIEHAVALADHARDRIETDDSLVAVAAGNFTNVCFTWVPPEFRSVDLVSLSGSDRSRLNQLAPIVKARMQRDGTAMIGFQPLDGLNVFRLIFMNPEVTHRDVDALIDLVAHSSEAAWVAI